jgi:hypothetical protein
MSLEGNREMKVLVCGGRTFNQYSLLSRTLNEFHSINKITCLAHGGARGADMLSGHWARGQRVPVQVYKADWERYGRSAGPIRNLQMLTEFKPDVVIAFPGGNGTQHMVKAAHIKKVPVIQVQYDQ